MSIIRDLVEYSGLYGDLPIYIDNFSNFSINEFITINSSKPSIKQISKISINTEVTGYHLVKSTSGLSYSGVSSKNYKYLCNCMIYWRIEYINDCTNSIFSIYQKTSFDAVVPIDPIYRYTTPIINIFVDNCNIELLSQTDFMLNFSGIVVIENHE